MFGDLLELATTLVNPEHEPDIAHHITGSSSSSASAVMARTKRGHSKSASISSTPEVNGMPPPATPASKSSSPVRQRRSRSTTSPPGSPAPAAILAQVNESASHTSPHLRFFAVLVLSLILSVVLQTGASYVGTGELAAVSKHRESWVEVSALLGWKVALLALYWYGGFDAYDVAALTLLLSTPSTLLLGLFYLIHPSTLVLTTATTVLSTSLPFYLLRGTAPYHHPTKATSHGTTSATPLRNRPILTDPYTTTATSLLAATVFAVLLEVSFASFLPSFLAVNFAGLRSLANVYLGAAVLPRLLMALMPAGVACMEFLFSPSLATPSAASTTPASVAFDPETAGLAEHVRWNLWGWYTARQKELISRTVLLAVLIVVESVVQIWGVIEGAELVGGLGYAGIWGVGVLVVGAVLDWVGGPSD